MPGPSLILCLVLIGIAILAASRFGKRGRAGYSFTGRLLMSESEIRFFRVLQMAAPNELVFPQVGMPAVVRPNYVAADARYMPAFRTISQKRIDFVICKRDSLEVRCLVELDDSTHDSRRDQDRDAVTTLAGYRTVRVRAARRYDIDALRRRVMDTLDLEERLSG